MDKGLRNLLGSPLAGLPILRDCQSKRISSYDRTGKNEDYIKIEPNETAILAKIEGAGCIRHLWFTISCQDRHYLRKLVLRMYWDQEKDPSVEVPVGDFFGVGHGLANHFISLPLNMTRGKGAGNRAGMNCFFPMPFAKGARIEVGNQCQLPVHSFYYYVDYQAYHELEDNLGRFHAWWNRENPCQGKETEVNFTGRENYLILEAEGKGHYVGCNLSVHNLNQTPVPYTWFGEGDDMIFIDKEKWPPSLHGTGTEDYFCVAWGFPTGEYSGPYHGVSLAGNLKDWMGKWTVYRFHLEDPVAFQKSVRVTIEHGHANNRSDDYSSCAYWYQVEPHKKFPPLPAVKKRLPIESWQILAK